MLTRTEPTNETPNRATRRIAATVLLALLAGAVLLHQRSWSAAQAELATLASTHGLKGGDLAEIVQRMRREADPAAAQQLLAARLFDLEIANPEPGSPASAERLLATRELARAVLRNEPASWQAAMILGATVSLERARNRDTRIFSLARDWERPLLLAGELAPAEKQPRRLLAAAYLEVWPALTPEKRRTVETLLREAFLEPQTFERLYAPWVALAGSLDRAATLLPDTPVTWKRLSATALDRRSWSEFATLEAKWRERLRRSLADQIAAARSAGPAEARQLYSAVLSAAPVERDFAGLVEEVLERLPPGPATESQMQSAARWWAWAEPLCLVRTCPLSPGAIGRIGSLSGARLSGAEAAFVALAAGDRPRAELLERRSDELWSEPWAPFVTFKAQREAALKEVPAARTTLLGVHRAFRSRLAWRLLAERLAASGVSPGAPLARDSWEASDWWFDRGASRLDLLPNRRRTGLRLEAAEAPRVDALLEIQWDGAAMPPVVLAAGTRTAHLPYPVADEPHLLELRVRTGDLRPAMRVALD